MKNTSTVEKVSADQNRAKAKFITKEFSFLWHAERFQNRLYEKHDHVQLINFPRFGDAGTYTWEVR